MHIILNVVNIINFDLFKQWDRMLGHFSTICTVRMVQPMVLISWDGCHNVYVYSLNIICCNVCLWETVCIVCRPKNIWKITIPTTGLHHSDTPQCLPTGDMLLYHFKTSLYKTLRVHYDHWQSKDQEDFMNNSRWRTTAYFTARIYIHHDEHNSWTAKTQIKIICSTYQ